MLLLVIFIVVPLIEIGLFIQIGGAIGLWQTLGVVVLTAIIGTTLMRKQGLSTMAKLQASLQNGADPTGPMAHGALLLVSGLLLLTPGFFTDALGFSLLVPAIRSKAIAYIKTKVSAKIIAGAGAQPNQQPFDDTTIDGEFEPVDEDGKPGTSGWTKRP